jgi:CubicO group peptidase (beta-lactamase class C family)
MRHGLGWWVFPSPAGDMYQHTGAGPGFATIFRLYPKDSLGIAVLANGTSLDREGIADRLYDVFREQPVASER